VIARLLVFIPASLLAACSSDPIAPAGPTAPHVDETFAAGPFTVPAGKEIVTCTYVRGDNATEEDVSAFVTEQSKGGHHLIAYTADHAIDLPPGPCSQGGQPGWTQIVMTQLEHDAVQFPASVGYHVRAHQQYVLETHFINTTAAEETTHSSLGIQYAPKGTVTNVAASYFFGTQNLDLLPNAKTTANVACRAPYAMSLQTMFGHQHQHGTGVRVGLARGKDTAAPLYASTSWDAPEIQAFNDGLAFGPTDALSIACDYTNDGPTSLRYPHEMCYAAGYFWPSDGLEVFCISGGGSGVCQCQSTLTDAGPGGSSITLDVTRAAKLAGVVGDPASGAPIYCTAFQAKDYGSLGPNPGAKPYYFTQIVDHPLADDKATATLHFDDVTPGDYAIACTMDTIGGGFLPGSGDIATSKAAMVTPKKGEDAHATAVLDFVL
jgi:hypothetical protein